MPQSLAQVLVHLVFSTKNRERWLDEDLRDELHAYIGELVRNLRGKLIRAGSVPDHIHLLIAHPRTISPSDLVKEIKSSSTRWLKEKCGKYNGFYWQNGYGLFSISPSHLTAVEAYIGSQAEHHKTISFQDEYRRMLEKYGLEYDERYVWE